MRTWCPRGVGCLGMVGLLVAGQPGMAAPGPWLEVGLAVREITPEPPIWLAGYAGRKKPADRVEHALLAQGLALRNPDGARAVLVALDNCEVNREFMEPVRRQCAERFGLGPGAVCVVSSHTHSGPVLESALEGMYPLGAADQERIRSYSQFLQRRLVEVVEAALGDLQPALLDFGLGRATFAMNRRVYQGDKVVFGDNPDGPVDWDVPVLRVSGTNGALRAIVFGYACHGTSVRGGDDWYVVSGEYMAYARQHLEAVYPGAVALFLTGMGADSDPSPRGRLLDARRHGLELAGAVVGVLGRPLRPVRGPCRLVYEELDLPFVELPGRERLGQDAQSQDVYIKRRAESFLARLRQGRPLPASARVPLGVLRVGEDLTFVLLGGEVVVDYSRRLKRLLAADHPWLVGYAYEVPCYIPSARLLKEGGYEADFSLVYYGFYGPFRPEVEDRVVNRVTALVSGLRGR